MIRMIAEDGPCSEKLLGDDDPNQGMWQRQAREPNPFMRVSFEPGIKTIGATDQDGQRRSSVAPAFKPRSQCATGQIVTVFIECDDGGAAGNRLANSNGLGSHPSRRMTARATDVRAYLCPVQS